MGDILCAAVMVWLRNVGTARRVPSRYIDGGRAAVFARYGLFCRGTAVATSHGRVLGGPLLPLLLLAIPFAMGVVVVVAGIASWVQPSRSVPRAVVVKTQSVRGPR